MYDQTNDRDLTARVFVLGTVAGGVALGGFVTGGMTLAGRLSGHALFPSAAALFLLGCAAGSVPAALLGYLGHPSGPRRREAGRALLRGLLALPVAMIFGAVLSGWIAMAGISSFLRSPVHSAAVGAAWLLGLTTLSIAACEALACLRNIRQRWLPGEPESTSGSGWEK
jgi:hypothetical protein